MSARCPFLSPSIARSFVSILAPLLLDHEHHHDHDYMNHTPFAGIPVAVETWRASSSSSVLRFWLRLSSLDARL